MCTKYKNKSLARLCNRDMNKTKIANVNCELKPKFYFLINDKSYYTKKII